MEADLFLFVRFFVRFFSIRKHEAKELLNTARPETIAQASSLPGITPAAIGAVIIYMRQMAA